MIGSLGNIIGMVVYENVNAITSHQVRFPRTKCKRIQKKWKKDKRNFVDKPSAFIIGDKSIVIHPELNKKLQDEIKRKNELYEIKWR